jgi:signal transduction histidine kinase
MQVEIARRWWTDGAVALAVAAVQLGGTSAVAAHRAGSVSAVGYLLLLAGPVALLWRRWFPAAVVGVTYAITFGYLATGDPAGGIWLSVIVALGTAVYLRRRVAAVAFLVTGYVVFLWGPAVVGVGHLPAPGFALGLGGGLLVLLVTAEWVRLWRARAAAVRVGREQAALRRAGEERLRLARDLHDIVAHSIAVINVQANTALHLMDRQPERARSALATINEVSRQALVELRSVLGVLRADEGGAPSRSPGPSLARLAELVATARASGLRVDVEQLGRPDGLPAEVDVAAYRIVQEALTNAARHSADHAAQLRIAYEPRRLRLQVDNAGQADGRHGDVTGSGLAGMRERARLLGGELHAGPGEDGRFRVVAVLPVDGA